MRAPLRPLLAAALAGAALAGCAQARPDDVPAGGSTRAARFVDRDGDGTLERGPGERLAARTELAPRARPEATLAQLALLADVHVRDEESPARVPFLDRYGAPLSSTFRPQEALSAQVLAAAVRAVRAARPDAALLLGDLVDEPQVNELAMAGAVLRGGRVRPDSGAPGYDGVQRAANPDPAYYRPDVDPPRHPGLLARAERPFRSPGLGVPWLALPGNHDLLLAGELPRTATTNAVATGDRALVAPDEDVPIDVDESQLTATLVDRLLRRGLPGRTRRVARDPARRELAPAAAARALARVQGRRADPVTGRLDAVLDVGRHVRVLALDTVRRSGGARGLVTRAQVAWLRRQLRRAGHRWILVASHHPLTKAAGGRAALALLERAPRVVAAVAGDAHRHRITARRTPAGGFWLVQTASLADFPQQGRILRLRRTAGGGVVLETWALDTAPDPGGADVARALAYLDAQGGRPAGFAGTGADRNASLFKRARGAVPSSAP